MIGLSVSPEDGETDLLGKTGAELQTGVAVSGGSITGTLKYVTGYTGFSSVVAEQEGNYLALKVDPVPSDATVTVELVGGTKGPVELDSDLNIVLRISNKDTQSVKVTASKNGKSSSRTFRLNGLTLETA